jgi:CheY-like chemotaxis protein
VARRNLLLADDSITIQKVVNLTFADEGIDVTTVGDGEAALEKLSAESPDILLADVNMPGPNGYEICELLRSDEATRNIPVILLVGSFEPFDETEAARVGANAYLTKPFQSIKQLVAQVNDLIDAANPVQDEVGADIELIQPIGTVERSSNGKVAESAEPPAPEGPPAEARHFDDLGYAANSPEKSEAVQPDDIESLYSKSLATLSPEEQFSDIGIDDEMIETSYSAETTNSDLTSIDTGSVLDANVEDSALDQLDTASEEAVETSHDSIGYISGYEQRFPEDPSKFESTIAYDNWQPADMRDEEAVDNEPPPASFSELDRAVEGNGPEGGNTTHSENGDQSEQIINSGAVGEDTIRMEGRFDTRGSGTFEFDDTNLLDLSPAEEKSVEITSPLNAIEQGSNKQIVTLSPELIEIIAQRVVEKLSEKY